MFYWFSMVVKVTTYYHKKGICSEDLESGLQLSKDKKESEGLVCFCTPAPPVLSSTLLKFSKALAGLNLGL